MKRTVAIGIQDFETLRTENRFYIDKTELIREWWNRGDAVTLLTRPRRFGKTLNMSMLNCFFSRNYQNRSDLFEGLKVWEDEEIRKEQGRWPVVFLSFANIKFDSITETIASLNQLIANEYNRYARMIQEPGFTDADRAYFNMVNRDMPVSVAADSLNRLSEWIFRYYGKKVIILLDEYDTPMQEAYVHGFWKELVSYIRALFNGTFKTNPSLARGIMTGITRVSKESIFSDLNNLEVVTTSSNRYADCFGFTEEEVYDALEEQGFGIEANAEVKKWYDGFTFGGVTDIYNPWSVINYLDKRKPDTYWANTSGNAS